MTSRAFVSRFSPNRTDPAVLEVIFVQRHRLAEVWLERLRDSVFTGVKHHLLAVGPRGCGKSHLVALLVGRLRKDPSLMERVRIAWLPEDEATSSFWKLLLRILRALNAEYGNEFPPPPRDELTGITDDRRSAMLTDYLLKKLDGRTLLMVVENLDDVMRGLKDEGQKRWRSFLQEHSVAATLATSQQLTEDLSDRDRPFFNFYQIEHLQPLSADEALSLLRKIAEHNNDNSLSGFLQSPTGRARMRAIRHLTGGSHRIFIILSEFATRESLDDLVTAFEELLDELTPYYQERLRWLSDQQREIVEFLCRQARTVRVKEIATELFMTEQTAAAQLKSLKDKGYVTAESVGRESRYELAEPLMRLCVEVKNPQREPIRLIVEFLRVWYDRAGLETRLQCLSADADLERRYFHAALWAHPPGLPGQIEEALNLDLEAARATGDREEIVRVLVELAATADSAWRCCAIARELSDLGRHEKVLSASERAIELEPNLATSWLWKGWALYSMGRYEDAIATCDRATGLDPKSALAWNTKGWSVYNLGRYQEALVAFDRAIGLDPQSATSWLWKGAALKNLGLHGEALAALDRAIELDANSAPSWSWKGQTLKTLGRQEEALAAFDRAIELDPKSAWDWIWKVQALNSLNRYEEALAFCDQAIDVDPKNPFAVAVRLTAFALRCQAKASLGRMDDALPELVESVYTDVIVGSFRRSTDRGEWVQRVKELADSVKSAHEDWKQLKAQEKEKPSTSTANAATDHTSPISLARLGDWLVRGLTNPAYAEVSADALDTWVGVWQEVAERHPDLSLATRLFGVGVRYLQTKDERVLLDLVQEERSILRDLFGLDEGTHAR